MPTAERTALDEPGRPAAGQRRHLPREVAQCIAPGGEPRLDGQRRRREGVGPVRPPTTVPSSEDRRRVHSERRQEQQVAAIHVGERRHPLADALDPSPASDQAKRDVGADRRRQVQIATARPAQDGAGVGRAAAQAAAQGDPLVEADTAPSARRPPGPGVIRFFEDAGRSDARVPGAASTTRPEPPSSISSTSARSSVTISASSS